MKQFALLFCLALITAVSCKEKDLSGNNPALPNENLQLKISFLYDGKIYTSDSLLENKLGQKFYVTNLKLLITNLYFKSTQDSMLLDSGYYAFDRKTPTQFVAFIEGGGYSGRYGFRLGLDSLQTLKANPETARGNGLTNVHVARNDDYGYNALVIEGLALDPTDTTDTTGSIPFQYHVGGYYIYKNYISDRLNFSVSNTTTANFIITVDIEPILNNFDILANEAILSDPTDPVDFEIAERMLDSLEVGLF